MITCHWRGWYNLSFGLLEKSILLIIEVELPHQKRLKQREILSNIVPQTVLVTRQVVLCIVFPVF